MDPRNPTYTWKIRNFSRLTQKKHYSDVFAVGRSHWRIVIHPTVPPSNSDRNRRTRFHSRFPSIGGHTSDDFGIYLNVPDAASLPTGWNRKARFVLTVVNQYDGSFTMKKDTVHVFKEQDDEWGFPSFMPMPHLRNLKRGFLVNDMVIIRAAVDVLSVVPLRVTPDPAPCSPTHDATPLIDACSVEEMSPPPSVPSPVVDDRPFETNRFDSFFTKLEEFVIAAETKEESWLNNESHDRMVDLVSGSPSFEEVEEAKQSLKECLSDLFKLSMKDRLAAALLTLTRAEVGLSCHQQRSISAFWDNFDDFISDFLMFEQDNSDFELQKLARDQMFSLMKKNRDTHISNKQLLEVLTKEGEELKKRLEEVNSRKQKLISDWESLMAKSKEMQSRYRAQEKKLAEAEEKKRIAEERMSRSTAAWSSLKAQFTEVKSEPGVTHEHGSSVTPLQSPKSPAESEEETKYSYVPLALENMLNLQVVHFRRLERPKQDDFVLELSKLHNYDEVVERVAHQIGLSDPSVVRLTSHNCHSQQPKPQPIKYRGVQNLLDMLVHCNQTSDILYYEVLDVPLPELQGLKNLKVSFHHARNGEVVVHNLRLPKNSTVGDVLNELKTKVELSHPDVELRLLEVFYHKIYKIFTSDDKIENILDQYWSLRAEEIPEDEKNLGPGDCVIPAYHFIKETAQHQMQVIQNFGEPLLLVIHECETLGEVKLRVQKKLRVPDADFSKWRFAYVSMGLPEYLNDSVVLSNHFQRKDSYGAWERYLGLEHPDYAS